MIQAACWPAGYLGSLNVSSSPTALTTAFNIADRTVGNPEGLRRSQVSSVCVILLARSVLGFAGNTVKVRCPGRKMTWWWPADARSDKSNAPTSFDAAILDATRNAEIKPGPVSAPAALPSTLRTFVVLCACKRACRLQPVDHEHYHEEGRLRGKIRRGTRVRRLLDTSMSYVYGQLGNTSVDLTKAERRVRL